MYSFINKKKIRDLAKPKSGAPVNYSSFTEKDLQRNAPKSSILLTKSNELNGKTRKFPKHNMQITKSDIQSENPVRF